MKRKHILASAVLVTATLTSSMTSASLINVASVTASSSFSTYDVNNLINGSGLSGDLHTGDWTTKWLTNGTHEATLTFDLGSEFDVATSSIWNHGNGCCSPNRSAKDLAISASLDGINYFDIGQFVLSQPIGDPFAAETLALNITARFIKFDISSNYGFDYTGLSEVQFNGELATVRQVPEPTTLALLGLGLAGIGFSRRRKAG